MNPANRAESLARALLEAAMDTQQEDTGERRDMTHSFEAMVAMTTPGSQKALRILAKSIHRELKAAGYSRNDIVQLSGELLELVTTDIRTSEAPGR